MKKTKLVYSVLIMLFLFFSVNMPSFADNIGAHSDTLRAGFFYSPGFNDISSDGVYSGYGYEVTERINQLNDWNIEYIGYDMSIDDQLAMLRHGELDMIVGLGYSIDRNRDFLISNNDIGNSSFMLTARYDDERFTEGNYSDWPFMTIGYYYENDLLKQFMEYAKEHNINYELKQFKEIPNCDYFANESIDAFISSGYRLVDLSKEKVIAFFGEEYKYILVNKNNHELLDEIDSTLETMLQYDPDVFSKLKKKYYKIDNSVKVRFTLEERQYIADHKDKPITAVVYKNLRPFHYESAAGEEGILPKYIQLINDVSGLNIELVSLDNYDSYVYAVKVGNSEICADFVYSNYGADKMNVRLTNPYMNVSVAKVMLKDSAAKAKSVGVYSTFNFISLYEKEQIGTDDIIEFTDIKECLDALVSGKIGEAYIPSYSVSSYLKNYEYSRLSYETLPDTNFSYCMAVNNENDLILANIISKSIYYVGDAILQEMIVSEINENEISGQSFSDFLLRNKWVVWVAVFVFVSAIVLIVVIITINTKRIQETRLANQTSEKFNAILASNIMAYEIVGLDGKTHLYSYHISEENDKDYVIKEEKHGPDIQRIINSIHPDDVPLVKEYIDPESFINVVRKKRHIYKEVRFAYKEHDKNYYYTGVTITYIDTEADNKILILFKDIDLAKKDEEEKRYTLQMALDTARSYGNLRSTFLSQITHDLRTPMNAIVGMTTIAQLNIDDKAKVNECLDTISNSSDHLISLLNDILDVTRIETGRFTFNQKRIRIKTVLKNTIEMLSKKAKDNNILIIVEDNTVVHDHVLADETRLEQIFGNIISNAIKYSDMNNRIEVSLRETTQPSDSSYFYEFIVKDYGIGMSDETLANLYTPFERGEEAKVKEGTGLGMTITKSIIEAMGGMISVQSKLNEGTTFTINLSFNDETINSLSNVTELAGKKALVISDDIRIRDLLCAIFEEGNMECVTMDKYELSDVFADNEFLIIATYFEESVDEIGKHLIEIRNVVGRNPIITCVTGEDMRIMSSFTKDFRLDGFVSIKECKEELIRLISDTIDSKNLSKKIKLESNLNGKRVLIVEDVEINAIFAKAISEMKGMKADIAENGKIAVEMLENCKAGYYDIIFMDLHMPVMDGFTAASLIRSSTRKYLKKVPIIAMSANTFPEDIIKCKTVGMNDYISKPIDLNVFNEITEKYAK